jgi:hypothetical protein
MDGEQRTPHGPREEAECLSASRFCHALCHPVSLLTKQTANRYLKEWGYDHDRMTRPPAAVRFEAEHSNALWHFDLSPSDLKQVECPSWVEPGRGAPTLMIYSVVDDRSGVAYQDGGLR